MSKLTNLSIKCVKDYNILTKSINKFRFNQNIGNNKYGIIRLDSKISFHTSSRAYGLDILSESAGLFFIGSYLGYSLKLLNKTKAEQNSFKHWLIRSKLKLGFAFITTLASFSIYYLSHIEETPITGRKRFISINEERMNAIYESKFNQLKRLYINEFLPNSHQKVQRVVRIATKLIDGNKDLEEIRNKKWTISVVDYPTIKNAFVLQTGNIFVFTGMIDSCDNDQQLAAVISHEIAHAVLSHGSEQASHAKIVDMLFICMIGAIWALIPDSYASHMTTKFCRYVMENILNTAYSRLLETEADLVGLEMMAKACFDVREMSALWLKYSIFEGNNRFKNIDNVEHDFLSTHPSNEKRNYYLDSVMDNMIELRNNCNCPELTQIDPREVIKQKGKKKIIAENKIIDVCVLSIPTTK